MSSETTDSDRLLARGVPITLADGETVRLRYGFRELKLLEDEFGDLGEVQETFESLLNSPPGEVSGKFFGPLCTFLYVGLLNLDLTENQTLDRLDTARLQDYCEAIGKAFDQAFPEASAGNVNGEPAGTGSPGTSSTGQRPAVSDAATNSSGA